MYRRTYIPFIVPLRLAYSFIMHIEAFREYCLAKPWVTESFPFGPDTLVFKVMDKMFALTALDSERFTVNLKCHPDQALEWRESYPEVQPGYHMNKKHWNTVDFEGTLEDKHLFQMIDVSYDLVVRTLPKKLQEEFKKG